MKNIGILILLLMLPILSIAVEVRQKGVVVTDTEHSASMLLEEADEVFQSRDFETALEKYTVVVEAAREEFNRSVEVEALSQMARMNLILNNKDKGREWLVKAQSTASDSDPMGWSRYLGVKGRFEWQDKDLSQAHETFDQMYDYCNSNALWGRAVDAAHMIAIVAESPEEQIKWGRLGIEAAEAGDVESWLGPLWNNLAGTYYDLKQFDSTLECYQKAREYHWRHSGEVGKLFADYHIGMTYHLLGNDEEAGKWLRPVLAWAERLENHSAIGQACEDLGEIEIAKGNKPEGLILLKRARSEYKLEGFDKSWPEVWNHINNRITELEK
ncbi:MAG: tetratricopeptide repeat protein [candidate division Zixibacteria bacterium]|nr:tetratricopeptide repeat protein [candidate division Zixibacteria bacterium]